VVPDAHCEKETAGRDKHQEIMTTECHYPVFFFFEKKDTKIFEYV